MAQKLSINAVLDFWFSKSVSEHWFSSTPEIDRQITEQFEVVWEQARVGKLDDWKKSAEGCLALCILLDQLPLNMFRGEIKGFSTEQQAVGVSKSAIETGLDKKISKNQIAFLYMPLMHSENLEDQDLSVSKFEESGLEGNFRFAKHHRELIREFGRFPHRNKILGRESSQAETDYLKSDKAFTG